MRKRVRDRTLGNKVVSICRVQVRVLTRGVGEDSFLGLNADLSSEFIASVRFQRLMSIPLTGRPSPSYTGGTYYRPDDLPTFSHNVLLNRPEL